MKLIGFAVALHWAAVCFVPVAAQDISSLGTLLSNVQQYASLASQILSIAQPFLGGTNSVNQDAPIGPLSQSNGYSSYLTSSNSYPQGDSLHGYGGDTGYSRQSSGIGGLLGQFLGGGGSGGTSLSDLLSPPSSRSSTHTAPKLRANGASIRKVSAERVRQQEFENLLASFVGSGIQPARPDPTADRGLLSEFFGRRKRRSAPSK